MRIDIKMFCCGKHVGKMFVWSVCFMVNSMKHESFNMQIDWVPCAPPTCAASPGRQVISLCVLRYYSRRDSSSVSIHQNQRLAEMSHGKCALRLFVCLFVV